MCRTQVHTNKHKQRKVLRYQRGNQKPWIEEQTAQKDNQRSTTYYTET